MKKVKQSSGIKNDMVFQHKWSGSLSNGMTLLFMKQRDNGKMVEENSRHSKQKIKMP